MQFVIDDIVEIIEDFVNDHQLSKGLRQGEVVRLKAAIDLLQTYESTLPDDILGAIRDIIRFTANLSDGKKKENYEDEADEKGELKKESVHDWGFSLVPNSNDFEKEETKKRRRKKSKKHSWGFSLADLDIEKEDIEKDEDEE